MPAGIMSRLCGWRQLRVFAAAPRHSVDHSGYGVSLERRSFKITQLLFFNFILVIQGFVDCESQNQMVEIEFTCWRLYACIDPF